MSKLSFEQYGRDDVQGRDTNDDTMEMITFRNDATFSSAVTAKLMLPNQADPVELQGCLIALIVFMKMEVDEKQ